MIGLILGFGWVIWATIAEDVGRNAAKQAIAQQQTRSILPPGTSDVLYLRDCGGWLTSGWGCGGGRENIDWWWTLEAALHTKLPSDAVILRIERERGEFWVYARRASSRIRIEPTLK